MKKINIYIIEKFKINKDIDSNYNEFSGAKEFFEYLEKEFNLTVNINGSIAKIIYYENPNKSLENKCLVEIAFYKNGWQYMVEEKGKTRIGINTKLRTASKLVLIEENTTFKYDSIDAQKLFNFLKHIYENY